MASERLCHQCDATYPAGTYGSHKTGHPPKARGIQRRSQDPNRDSAIASEVTAGLTLAAVGARYGLTRERVRQIVLSQIGMHVRDFKPLVGRPPRIDRSSRTVRRFWARVRVDESGCWLWTGGVTKAGYGHTGNKPHQYAHRASFEAFRGPIPAGLELDRLCRQPSCVNPDHLEAVTHRENVRRGKNGILRHLKKPTKLALLREQGVGCLRGHPLSDRTASGQCRSCTHGRYIARKAAAA